MIGVSVRSARTRRVTVGVPDSRTSLLSGADVNISRPATGCDGVEMACCSVSVVLSVTVSVPPSVLPSPSGPSFTTVDAREVGQEACRT